jgi:hypothetical protein
MDAMKTGNLKKFNDNLEANQEFFIKKGVYLLLEKLKTFVYRNLFRKVYVASSLHSQHPSSLATHF